MFLLQKLQFYNAKFFNLTKFQFLLSNLISTTKISSFNKISLITNNFYNII
jgi:hypothetical protein